MTIQYNGGYYLLNEPLVRDSGANAHTAADLTQISNYTLNAVNYIQDTPWMINKYILHVIQRLQENGTNVLNSYGEVALRLAEPENPLSDPHHPVLQRIPLERWQAMTKEEKTGHKAQRKYTVDQYKSELGEYRATLGLIISAEEMAEHAQFFYPHNMDFRTRIYPIPSGVHPQGNDLSRG